MALMVILILLELGHNKQIITHVWSNAVGTMQIENKESQLIKIMRNRKSTSAVYFPDAEINCEEKG